MEVVDKETFASVMDSSVHIRDCPHCGHVAEVRIAKPTYGRVGARVECLTCGCQTKYVGISGCYINEDDGRIGTPVTPETMMRGILEAIKLWNGTNKLQKDSDN